MKEIYPYSCEIIRKDNNKMQNIFQYKTVKKKRENEMLSKSG